MSQAFIGSGYIQSIFEREIAEYLNRTTDTSSAPPIDLVTHVRFNPNLTGFWFGGVMEVINNVNMLTIILVGAAYIREREHGTLEHLLAMPLGATEIMISKIWANGLAVLIGASFALIFVIKIALGVPIAGSIALFIGAAAVYLFSAASIGIFLGTLARSMPQLGLLIFLTITRCKCFQADDIAGKYAGMGPERYAIRTDHLLWSGWPNPSCTGEPDSPSSGLNSSQWR